MCKVSNYERCNPEPKPLTYTINDSLTLKCYGKKQKKTLTKLFLLSTLTFLDFIQYLEFSGRRHSCPHQRFQSLLLNITETTQKKDPNIASRHCLKNKKIQFFLSGNLLKPGRTEKDEAKGIPFLSAERCQVFSALLETRPRGG